MLFRWIWSTGKSGMLQNPGRQPQGTCTCVPLLSHCTRVPKSRKTKARRVACQSGAKGLGFNSRSMIIHFRLLSRYYDEAFSCGFSVVGLVFNMPMREIIKSGTVLNYQFRNIDHIKNINSQIY